VVIHALDVIYYEAPYLRLRVTCSKGTYIRVLGEDIGAALGCGAHLHALRRTEVGALTLDNAVTLVALAELAEDEREQKLSPVDALLSTFPVIRLPEVLAKRFMHGQRIALGKEGLPYPPYQGRARVYSVESERLMGTAHLMEYGILAPERLIAERSNT
jgi:tRNA pseudouridine55 synthase